MQQPSGTERRRRRSHSRRTTGKWQRVLGGGPGDIRLLAVMAAVSLAYVGSQAYAVRQASRFYSDLALNIGRPDVRYFLGAPAQVADAAGRSVSQDSATRWFYDRDGGRVEVVFSDEGGLIERITCRDRGTSALSCPSTLGLSVGSGEDKVWNRLGAPDVQRYVGDAKVIEYRSLGLRFTLRRFLVSEIELERHEGGGSPFDRLISVLIP